MKVLVVGGGGREHAIIKKLKENKNITEMYASPGNGGIAGDAVCLPYKATDLVNIPNFAKENSIDFVVIAPDDPLVLGMADELERLGIRYFGPSKAAAQLEGSKIFAKKLMKKYGIPTGGYEEFSSFERAAEYVEEQNRYPVVIKADGLALGKGVVIAANLDEAKTALREMLLDKVFGESGSRVIIEEFLEGPEVSVLAFTDGKTVRPMVSSMDHKRALDGNMGLNTGGMGTVAPNPHYTKETDKFCYYNIFMPTIKAMQKEGAPFKGCLYFGLMLTKDGPKVIEYNCRFGDPETQVVLPLLKTDLLEIMNAVYDERLDELDIQWEDKSCVCVVMASGGYPQKYETGYKISGICEDQQAGAMVYHAGTKRDKDGGILTAGGRVLGVTAMGESLDKAIENAYSAVEKIGFERMHFRKDIGKY